mgnify:CR=1 FL=1
MIEFLYKTKDGSTSQGKSKVYFACHPDDFDEHFAALSQVLFEKSNCAIYYKKNITEMIEDEDKEYYFNSFNLMIVPITRRLFANRNAAVYSEVAYAKVKDIPILPFIMDPSAVELYQNLSYFKNIQYIDAAARGTWHDKLKLYLDKVLLNDETASVVRNNFDGHIFLSYRKVDRTYAHEIMTFIHSYPEFRNVSIWYDEYLTFGEDFKNEIEREIERSDLVLLLMTPNTVKYCDDGTPNYIIREEYPAARNTYKKTVVPIVPESLPADVIDEISVRAEFPSIPDILCIETEKDAFFKRMRKCIKCGDKGDPEYNVKVGLAYLYGYGVEINKNYAIEYLSLAAEAGHRDALLLLYTLYYEGVLISPDYNEAAKWAEKLFLMDKENFGFDNKVTVDSLTKLADAKYLLEDSQKRSAINIYEMIFDIYTLFIEEIDKKSFDSIEIKNLNRESLILLREGVAIKCSMCYQSLLNNAQLEINELQRPLILLMDDMNTVLSEMLEVYKSTNGVLSKEDSEVLSYDKRMQEVYKRAVDNIKGSKERALLSYKAMMRNFLCVESKTIKQFLKNSYTYGAESSVSSAEQTLESYVHLFGEDDFTDEYKKEFSLIKNDLTSLQAREAANKKK